MLTPPWLSWHTPQEGLKAVVLPISTAPLQAGLAFVHSLHVIACPHLWNDIGMLYLTTLLVHNDSRFPGILALAAARTPPTA